MVPVLPRPVRHDTAITSSCSALFAGTGEAHRHSRRNSTTRASDGVASSEKRSQCRTPPRSRTSFMRWWSVLHPVLRCTSLCTPSRRNCTSCESTGIVYSSSSASSSAGALHAKRFGQTLCMSAEHGSSSWRYSSTSKASILSHPSCTARFKAPRQSRTLSGNVEGALVASRKGTIISFGTAQKIVAASSGEKPCSSNKKDERRKIVLVICSGSSSQ
mmetsp:Transcript_45974/g.92224  ORF Transcript_45974/g.92224 Transcript_45974/m.92224 type:complete len:217 (+) Transcript_45974:202-852(+)